MNNQVKIHNMQLTGLLTILVFGWWPNSFAQSHHVSLTGNYSFSQENPPVPGTYLSIQFDLPATSTTNAHFYTPDGIAWGYYDQPVTISFDATSYSLISYWVSWASFTPPVFAPYYAVDIRFTSIFEPDDFLQFVVDAPVAFFSGSVQSPTLSLMELQNLNGEMYYYAAGSLQPTSVPIFGAEYIATSIPEPAFYTLSTLTCLALLVKNKKKHTNP